MIQGLTNLARVPEREVGGMTRRNELSRVGTSSVKGLSLGAATSGKEGNLFFGKDVDEFAAVINFHLIPSGRIHMNREAREHIVDFFQ
jgi:hypothetical protein